MPTLIEGFSNIFPSAGGTGKSIVYLITGSTVSQVKNLMEYHIQMATTTHPPRAVLIRKYHLRIVSCGPGFTGSQTYTSSSDMPCMNPFGGSLIMFAIPPPILSIYRAVLL